MSFRAWREAEKALLDATEAASPEQHELAKQAGIMILPTIPRIVAAAMLRVALARALNLPGARPVSARHHARLGILSPSSGLVVSPASDDEAEAWVTYLRLVQRRASLAALMLNEGDIVRTAAGEVAEVSSIGEDGRVFFKGGRGFGTWPDLISVLARQNETSTSAVDARQQAANYAARRIASSNWSAAKSRDLRDFATDNTTSEDDLVELERVIEMADCERPIQEFLQSNPHLLTALLGGHERYCIAQKRLGGEYVPDFVIGDVDSLGVRWVLIELETPTSGIYLKDGLMLDEKARTGVGQIMDWRNWLSTNVSYARQRRSENGLGLYDIREKADALVIVGRRSHMPETKDALRIEYRQSNNIRIHTYDWLVDTLRGAIRYSGPPGTNPYLIRSHAASSMPEELAEL